MQENQFSRGALVITAKVHTVETTEGQKTAEYFSRMHRTNIQFITRTGSQRCQYPLYLTLFSRYTLRSMYICDPKHRIDCGIIVNPASPTQRLL